MAPRGRQGACISLWSEQGESNPHVLGGSQVPYQSAMLASWSPGAGYPRAGVLLPRTPGARRVWCGTWAWCSQGESNPCRLIERQSA